MAKTVAYIRVSTDKQDAENQRLGILELVNRKGLGKVEFVEETVSGRKSWRCRAVAGLIDGLEKGDNLVVSELSRLGRSMLEIMEILSICTNRGLKVYAAKGDWALNGTLQDKILAAVFAIAAEIERDLISRRTKEALATKRAQGIQLGRPRGPGKSKLDPHKDEIIELLALGIKKKSLAQKLGTSPENLRHWMKMRGIKG